MDTDLLSELWQLACEMTPENTIGKMPREQMLSLRHFFSEWARGMKRRNSTAEENADVLTLAFVLGHEWVERHWLLWPIDNSSRVQD